MVTITKKSKQNPLRGIQTLMILMGSCFLLFFFSVVSSNNNNINNGSTQQQQQQSSLSSSLSMIHKNNNNNNDHHLLYPDIVPSMIVSLDPPAVLPRSTVPLDCATAIMPLFWSATAHIDRIVPNPACPKQSQHLMTGPAPPIHFHITNSNTNDSNSNSKNKNRNDKNKTGGLTLVMTYYNRPLHLAHQVQSWISSWSDIVRREIVIVIVDDGSAMGLRAVEFLNANADAFNNNNHRNQPKKLLDIRVYEIDQDIPWNIGGARNLGVYMAPTEWIMLIDDDTIIPSSETMEYMLNLSKIKTTTTSTSLSKSSFSSFLKGTSATHPNHDRTIYYNFPMQQASSSTTTKTGGGNAAAAAGTGILLPHESIQVQVESMLSSSLTLLCTKVAFWLTTGFDEDFVGHYGQTNQHFLYRAQRTKRIVMKDMYHDMLKYRTTIPPLVQLSEELGTTSSLSCPSGYTCPDVTTIQQQQQQTIMTPDEKKKRSKDTNKNFTIFGRKQRTSIVWSKLFLRFSWRRVW